MTFRKKGNYHNLFGIIPSILSFSDGCLSSAGWKSNRFVNSSIEDSKRLLQMMADLKEEVLGQCNLPSPEEVEMIAGIIYRKKAVKLLGGVNQLFTTSAS